MEKRTKITVRDLNLYYGENHALKDVNMNIRENCVTAFIGPSGCGKSTFLKTINRMNDLVDGVRITGEVKLDDEDYLCRGCRYNRSSEKNWHGVSAAESVSVFNL